MTGDPGGPGTETGHLALQALGPRHEILVCWGENILSLGRSGGVYGSPGSPNSVQSLPSPIYFCSP